MKAMNLILLCLMIGLESSSCAKTTPPEEPPVNGGGDTETVHYAASPVSMASLLDEMVSFEESVYYPAPYYFSGQATSTDKRSVASDKPFWFANVDNTRYVRMGNDNADRRIEKVIFEQDGPGAITRIWTAGKVEHVTMRFYFDGEKTARLSFRTNDFTNIPFAVPDGLVLKHMHYDEKGGTSLHVPLPYKSGIKVTIDDPNPDFGFAFHIGYRAYEAGTDVTTFTMEQAQSLSGKMQQVAQTLKNPPTYDEGQVSQAISTVPAGGSLKLDLPEGANAVRNLVITLSGYNDSRYAELMRRLIVKMTFDGKETVRAPLGDFSAGGMGAFPVDDWYMSADGKGRCESRWIMPYRENAAIEIENISDREAKVRMEANVSEWKWHTNTMYFHCSWRQDRDLQTGNDYDSNGNEEWLVSRITGKAVHKGDVLSVYSYVDTWYGEGDEKIYFDGETFPSHFGTGIEDYYNTSFAPVIVFHTPFGGAVRADHSNSFGYSTWLRTRNLDGIVVNGSMSFNFELLGWYPSRVIFAATSYWYGDKESRAWETSGTEEAAAELP